VLLRTVLPSDGSTAAVSAPDAYRAMGRLLTRPSTVLFLLATATLLGGFVALYAGLPSAGPAVSADRPGTMLLLRAAALPAMVLVPLATPLLVRVPAAHRVVGALFLAGTVSGATALLTAGGGLGPVALGALLFVFALGVAVAAPAFVEVIGSAAGPARGAAVALYTFVLFTGAGLGPQLATSVGGGFATVSALVAGALYTGAALAAAGQHLITARKNATVGKERHDHAIPRPDPRPGPRRSLPAGYGPADRRHRRRYVPRRDGRRPDRRSCERRAGDPPDDGTGEQTGEAPAAGRR
ncbi:hypothetical protein ACFW15_28790, partial [Streptomyces sp. NPDC058953]